MIVRSLGLADYQATWDAMRRFTDERQPGTPDELWLLEHPPVYTLGMAADLAHVLDVRDIPLVQTDRGGQVTFHGPGQLIAYPLLDLARNRLTVRGLVVLLEQCVIDLLTPVGIAAQSRRDAPGVYVDGSKLAALGLRVRRGSSYHGLALNVDLDVAPFARINPCGMAGLQVTTLRALGVPWSVEETGRRFAHHLAARLQAPASERAVAAL